MTMAKRTYTRRSDEERIAELETKIQRIRGRLQEKKRKESPLMREIAKVQRTLRKFAQAAQDNGRADLANSATAFAAGLERSAKTVESSPAQAPKARSASEG